MSDVPYGVYKLTYIHHTMAEDLAIDVGIPNNSDEFDTFVSCVNSILDHGCGYSRAVTAQICERCETSALPIAKKVLRECRRIRQNTSRLRPSKLKWWETWQSKHESNVPRWPGRTPSPVNRSTKPPRIQRKKPVRRVTRPNKQKHAKPLLFKGKRPMSPMFERRRVDKRRHEQPERFYSGRAENEKRTDNSTRKRSRYR